ncbi:hypothetical protein [Shinella zoogloeoides]|uniref:hypothetical protein n=1 Tax=Shinella zoogloeoides TaxID=352475 RepID=UPI0028A68443|nr:hypothetical protein [Shinella zoogloeoides]
MRSSEFQPTMETNCMAAGMIQPREPNCGLDEAMESTPKRMATGTAASATMSMPIMLPARSVKKPSLKLR